MRSRSAILLAALAVVVLAAAWFFGRPPASVSESVAVPPGTLVFPGLAGNLASAARVEITGKGQTLVIVRNGGGWGLADRGNYPVQQDKLRELLTGLTELRITEPRTADPALLEQLGVGDPASALLPDWPDCMAIHRAYNDAIGRCAAKHPSVHVVPMHAEFLGHGVHCTQPWRAHYHRDDPHYWYAWNLEDPNVRGYDAIRRLFLIEIAKQAERLKGL